MTQMRDMRFIPAWSAHGEAASLEPIVFVLLDRFREFCSNKLHFADAIKTV